MLLIFFFIALYAFLDSFISFAKKRLQAGARPALTIGLHTQKKTTPSMGGILFFIPLFVSFFYTSLNKSIFIGIAVFTAGIIGLWDDIKKIFYKSGISAKQKFFTQLVGAFVAAALWYLSSSTFNTSINFCFFSLDVGAIGYILWATWILMSCAHAVNLTDGLDGLAISQVFIALCSLYFLTLGTYDIKINILLLGSACLVFFLKNKFPAKVFMGDVGSLMLGTWIGSLFLLCKLEILLPFVLIVPFLETLSVILQRIWLKFFKKKLFLFSPIHHHFEKLGWHESAIWKLAFTVGVGINFLTVILYNLLALC